MIILYDFHIFDKIFWSKCQMSFPTIKKGAVKAPLSPVYPLSCITWLQAPDFQTVSAWFSMQEFPAPFLHREEDLHWLHL